MHRSALSPIAAPISQLSLAAQLGRIERVAQRIRDKLVAPSALDPPLAAMAAEQERPYELRSLEEDWAPTAADGRDTP